LLINLIYQILFQKVNIMKKLKVIIPSIFILGVLTFNFAVINAPDTDSKISLAFLKSAFADSGESSGETYSGYFKTDRTDTIEGYAKLDAAGKILSFASVSFEGSVKVARTVSYTCCASGGGTCSKEHPKCSNVSLIGLIMGT
jgi:hypothetical protein